MSFSFSELNYLQLINKQFENFIKLYDLKIKRDLNSLIYIILFIETFHRNIVWRLIEYLFLIINIVMHNFYFKLPIINISIGKYQIKINYLFDYLQIYYLKKEKQIYIDRIIKIKSILKLCNKFDIIKDTIRKNVLISEINNLSDEEIYDILLFYSRNIEFKKNINYYTVSQYLMQKYCA